MPSGFIGGSVGYQMLRWIGCHSTTKGHRRESESRNHSKIEVLFNSGIWVELLGKTVIDFGCGTGTEAIAIAKRGAKEVIGIDIRQNCLDIARLAANRAGVADCCSFSTQTTKKADIVLSLDGFEHYKCPQEVLKIMRGLLKDDGQALVSFGPPWFHPLGGHLFSVFPWAHLIFTENRSSLQLRDLGGTPWQNRDRLWMRNRY